MFLYKNKIVITGGSGRFGSELKKIKNKYKLLFPNKRKLNILNLKMREKKSVDMLLHRKVPQF